MASGFPGSGRAEFYAGGTGNGGLTPSEPPLYRTNNLPGIQLDHLGNRTGAGLGKRSLADFQAAHHIRNTPAGNPFLFRSVRSRTFQNVPSHMYPFNNNHGRVTNDLSLLRRGFSQRNRFPVFQQPAGLSPAGSGFGFESFLNPVQNRVQTGQDSEGSNLNMMNRIKELEKQLLEDDDDSRDESDAVSGITAEWSETIQNLVVTPSLTPNQNQNPSLVVTPSLTPNQNQNQNQNPNLVSSSPASSSSSSSSVASPASLCSRQTVLEIATAVSEGNTDSAAEILARVSQTGSQNLGNSERKLMEMMLHALRLRVENPVPVSEMNGEDHLESIQLLYELSPCFKLGFMAANLAILEAALDPIRENGFHVVDFDVGKGGQYVNLVHALSAREFNSTVKITAVVDRDSGEDGKHKLKDVGESLSQLADRHGVRLVFNVLSLRFSDLSRDSLGCDPDEPLAVNLAFRMFSVPDESVCTENPRDAILRRVKGLAPRVVTFVEQEMNANTAPLVARVGEVCNYYGALLDSVESTVPATNPDRVRVEEALARKITNTVACEGANRTERCEVFGKWRVRMSMAGFELMPMSQAITESITSRLSNGSRIHRGFTVKEDNGGVCFGWMGRNLTVASAWR